MCTAPLTALAVTGNAAGLAGPPAACARAGPAPCRARDSHDSSGRKGRQATGKNSHNHPPSVHGGRSASAATPTRHRSDPPFLRGQVADAGQASGLVPSERGITVAGQRRDLTGFAGHNVILVRPRTGVLYRRNSWLGRHTMMAARRGLARPGSSAGGRTALAMTRADSLHPGTSER